MSSTTAKAKAETKAVPLSDHEIQQIFNEQRALERKIRELESEAEEHTLVLSTLEEALAEDPDRKCFRLIGGVLVEATVRDIVPSLKTNRDGILNVIANLTEQYTTKEKEFDSLKSAKVAR